MLRERGRSHFQQQGRAMERLSSYVGKQRLRHLQEKEHHERGSMHGEANLHVKALLGGRRILHEEVLDLAVSFRKRDCSRFQQWREQREVNGELELLCAGNGQFTLFQKQKPDTEVEHGWCTELFDVENGNAEPLPAVRRAM